MNEHNRKSLASFFVLGSQWCVTLCLLVTIILTSVSVYKVSILIVWEPALVEYSHSVSFHELHYSILVTQKLDSHSGFFTNVRGSPAVLCCSWAVWPWSHRQCFDSHTDLATWTQLQVQVDVSGDHPLWILESISEVCLFLSLAIARLIDLEYNPYIVYS